MSSKGNISVVQADKGGAILIVDPELLKTKVLEKLENPQLYEKLSDDPSNKLKKELFELWKRGKVEGHVNEKMAYQIVGVTENDTMSTLPKFKPGVPYFYPLLKIHKVRKEQLVPGVNPPARLVTSLRDGISKRSDVFLADRFLKALEKDYCGDLLVDTSDALRWLESENQSLPTDSKIQINAFTFDFKALYDSLEPNLVIEAVRSAMETCRPDWSNELKNWIISLIDFSLRASVAKYGGNWWKQRNGIPTGGSLCVQLANIAVFFVMYTKVYDVPDMMSHVTQVKRFIDDGAGFFSGTEAEFNNWLRAVNESIRPLGLYIDESSFRKNSSYINFLDIQYCFDNEGRLQTDLYIKETDSRSYLNFSSAHPNHTFSGNVYSQSLRLRRIINSQDRLRSRLDDLSVCFKKAGYPESMVLDITTKVFNMERDISVKQKVDSFNDNKIVVVSTYEADKNLVQSVKNSEENFKLTPSFRDQRGCLFKFVKKVGPSIKSHVNILKHLALETGRGCVKKCNGRGCKTCKMLLPTSSVKIGNRNIKLSKGSCKTTNTCYLGMCICEKPYTGRTVVELHNRINGHRSSYKEVLKKAETNTLEEIDATSDEYALGLHLYLDHGLTDPTAFDTHVKFGILDVVNPNDIMKKEFRWMHKVNSFQPLGINVEYPFGIPYLGQK